MTVSQKEKDAMSNWMSALNDDNDEMEPASDFSIDNSLATNDPGYVDPAFVPQDPSTAPINVEVDEEANKQAMKNIMESFGSLLDDTETREIIADSLQNVTEDVAYDAQFDKNLKRGLQTQPTQNGFIYGEYELMERKKSEKKSYYSIRHTGTGETLAKDLILKESALALVEMLNEGLPINNPKCLSALNYDSKYSSALIDMTQSKKKAQSGNPIAEDRYEHAKEKAIMAKKQAKVLFESL